MTCMTQPNSLLVLDSNYKQHLNNGVSGQISYAITACELTQKQVN